MNYKILKDPYFQRDYCFNDSKIKSVPNQRVGAPDNSVIFKVQITNENYKETCGSYKQTGNLKMDINGNYTVFNVFEFAEDNCKKDSTFFDKYADSCPPF